MDKTKILEKRKAERVSMVMRVAYKASTSKNEPREAVCKDISGKGIRLEADKPFKQGQFIRSLIYFPNDPMPIHIVDKVIWCRREAGPGGHFEIGAEHINISPRDREKFIFFICENLIERNLNKTETVTYGASR